ncbi:MAG: hypothetical protein LUC95_10155 [Lachnospiraceae bacterium]|nr:hypothetical protein [Lachnospiraceae bacterium]
MKRWIAEHAVLCRRILYLITAMLCVVCMLLIWPVGIIRTAVESHNGADGRISVGPLSSELCTEQYFVPQFSYLQEMAIALSYNEIQDENATVYFSIRNSAEEDIFTTELSILEFSSGGFYQFPVGISLKRGQTYSWVVCIESNATEEIGLLATSPDVITPVENSVLCYNGEVTSSAAVVDYVYGIIPGKSDLMIYYSFILTVFLLMVLGIRHLPAINRQPQKR